MELKFKHTDGDGDTVHVGLDATQEGSPVYVKVEEKGNSWQEAAAYLSTEAAIRLARELLRFYGAPLEEPKPEPKAGQIWDFDIVKGGERIRVVIVRVIGRDIEWLSEHGSASSNSISEFLEDATFVRESWAGEEK